MPDKVIHVALEKGLWTVRRGRKVVHSTHETKAEAVEVGRALARSEDRLLFIRPEK